MRGGWRFLWWCVVFRSPRLVLLDPKASESRIRANLKSLNSLSFPRPPLPLRFLLSLLVEKARISTSCSGPSLSHRLSPFSPHPAGATSAWATSCPALRREARLHRCTVYMG
ncbi:unnamed protein product [Vitrella brassicaformis CCMP3155]|uniref:Secreted protein n=1 Tax=Vitrella brassicaformis (strain CCMP3155) TaxID=1169540 RepID=A0A0G4EQA5_VITBC|nr:unnamed protein product [Vitrella brassicaformis CCMP3155]|eukprot:CEL99604.1 unnamed protein product [Vitrella brassicaformis CCMP3155]